MVRRALVSVSNKEGLVDFCQGLAQLGIEIISTGGTAKTLRKQNIPVEEVSEVTEFPEILDGRVKTLHPKIHAAILARRDVDLDTLKKYQIDPIDLVIVNLYPFEEHIQNNASLENIIENIDIGGPTLIRAAAKNYPWITVVVDPKDYPLILTQLQRNKELPISLREKLALKAFRYTARYDAIISQYLASIWETDPFPSQIHLVLTRSKELRYGENSHQKAALYLANRELPPGTIAGAVQLQGKALSYNNLVDADTAFECVMGFKEPACVIVKHANPCGVALGRNLTEAYLRAYEGDPVSAFGGVIAFNRELDGQTAQTVVEKQFVEVVLAPSVNREAQEQFAKKPNVRLLTVEGYQVQEGELEFKRISGGILVQERDTLFWDESSLRVVTQRRPTDGEWRDLRFAWQVVKFGKSNAIVYAREGRTVGIGVGQTSRVDAAKFGIWKAQQAGLSVSDAVMASEAFFPFRDSVDEAAKAGVKAIIQPGGSIRDPEVIAAADEHGIAMVFTGVRHFRH